MLPDEVNNSSDRLRLKDAFARYHASDWEGAIGICCELVERSSDLAAAWHLWGLSALRCGDAYTAMEKISRAIDLGPIRAHYFNHLGAAQEVAGNLREALQNFRQATQLDPRYVEAHANQATILERLNQLDLAEQALRRACAESPQQESLVCRWARILFALHRRGEAFGVLQSALVVAPKSTAIHLLLGHLQIELDDIDPAVLAYEAATQSSPLLSEAWFYLGASLGNQGNVCAARDAFTKAIKLQPDKTAWQLRRVLVSPTVFDSADDIARYQSDLQMDLESITNSDLKWNPGELLAADIYPPFAINFQGRQTRGVKERIAALVRDGQSYPSNRRVRNSKPRLGFVVTRGHEGLFCRCAAGIVDRLDRDEFDVVLIASQECLALLKRNLTAEVTYASLSRRYEQAVQTLRETQCDLLYHWEVGSDALNYLLPMTQSAAVQCTSWGTQVTSGLREVQYYLSSRWIERDDASNDYTETLVRLDSLPTWQRRIPAPPATNRSHFGWSDQQRIYICPQNLLKIHPDQDLLFARILDADPEGLIVLKQARSAEVARQLQARLQATLKQDAHRVVILPWLSTTDYYRLISVADVVLDPVGYSAGSSCYDMFSLHRPIVTWPGQLNVGRYTQACYRYIGYPELIVDSAESYVRQALRIAQDESYRVHIRKEIQERSDALFEDLRSVETHARFFRAVIQQVRTAR